MKYTTKINTITITTNIHITIIAAFNNLLVSPLNKFPPDNFNLF